MHYDIELNSAAHYPVKGIVDLSPMIEQAGFGAFWKGESNSTDPLVLISAGGLAYLAYFTMSVHPAP